MSRNYSIKSGAGGAAIAVTYKTIISAISDGSARIKLYEFDFGAIGPPADQVMQFSIDIETGMVAGTNNTSVTPNPVDSSPSGDVSPAAHSTAGGAWTTEPTVGANKMESGFNMRQFVRWVAKDRKELVTPAVAQEGPGLRMLSPTYTGDVRATLFYSED